MKSAILEHTQLPALRNQDPLDAFLAGMRQAKMELPALSTVTVEYGDKVYPLEPIFHSYVQKQLSASFVDFDDMIYMAVRLLLENRDAAAHLPVALRVRAGGRVPGPERSPAAPAADHWPAGEQHLCGRRRRPDDLRLSGRGREAHRGVREAVPGRLHACAEHELPLEPHDRPAYRLADPAQPGPGPQGHPAEAGCTAGALRGVRSCLAARTGEVRGRLAGGA